jgi:integral membrane sensor domain MASE1
VLLSPLAMQRALRRLVVAFVVVVAAVLILTVAIAKTISIVDKPHDAAAFVESAMGTYWPVILVVIALASVGIALFPLRRD